MVANKNNCSAHLPALKIGRYPPAMPYDADIIILTRNRYADTLAAVASALAQENLTFHISVLDQGSEPDIQTAFAEAFEHHENFGYFTISGNLGVAGGRNFLSSLGHGKIIIGLDNDAVFVTPLIAAGALRAFEQSPALGALGFKILSADGIHLDDHSWGYPAGLRKHCDSGFAATTFVGAGHAIRRTTWHNAGGYDADLFFTWEEYDFALRAIALGWSIRCDGNLAVIHKIAPEARVQWGWDRTWFFIRNRLILARKWHSSWASLSPRIGVYLGKAARERRLAPALAGLLAAFIQDRFLLKRPMNAQQILYIYRNETRHHKNPVAYFYRQILLKSGSFRPKPADSLLPSNHAPRHIALGIDRPTKPPAGSSPF